MTAQKTGEEELVNELLDRGAFPTRRAWTDSIYRRVMERWSDQPQEIKSALGTLSVVAESTDGSGLIALRQLLELAGVDSESARQAAWAANGDAS